MNEQIKAPLIGSEFSGPKDNAPREQSLQRKVAPKTSEAAPPAAEESSDEEERKPASSKDKPLTAAEKAVAYQEGLEEMEIPLDKARMILDAVIFEGVYTETLYIGGKRLPVDLRTRVYQDMQRLMHALEEEATSFPVHTNDIVAHYNVAASLARYGETHFAFPDVGSASDDEVAKAFKIRLKFLTSLPVTVINRLINHVVVFDRMIETVFAEGAPEDF